MAATWHAELHLPIRTPPSTVALSADAAFRAAIAAPLSTLVHTSSLPLTRPEGSPSVRLAGPFFLEVVSAVDITTAETGRDRSLAATPRARRGLKLMLTDGVKSVTAFEREPLRGLAPPYEGTKLLVRDVTVSDNIFLLETSGVLVLGRTAAVPAAAAVAAAEDALKIALDDVVVIEDTQPEQAPTRSPSVTARMPTPAPTPAPVALRAVPVPIQISREELEAFDIFDEPASGTRPPQPLRPAPQTVPHAVVVAASPQPPLHTLPLPRAASPVPPPQPAVFQSPLIPSWGSSSTMPTLGSGEGSGNRGGGAGEAVGAVGSRGAVATQINLTGFADAARSRAWPPLHTVDVLDARVVALRRFSFRTEYKLEALLVDSQTALQLAPLRDFADDGMLPAAETERAIETLAIPATSVWVRVSPAVIAARIGLSWVALAELKKSAGRLEAQTRVGRMETSFVRSLHAHPTLLHLPVPRDFTVAASQNDFCHEWMIESIAEF